MTTRVLGVLNVTPDSFSDGGRYVRIDAAISRGRELAAQGAHIVDVGGESTRPGAKPVPLDEELRRVIPVIEALTKSGIEVSIDTLHAATARAAVAAGASIVNDVSGGLADSEMRRAVAELGVVYVIGHWRGIPDLDHGRSEYTDVVGEVAGELAQLADAAVAAGVRTDRIVLDPGLGFDKTSAQGWALLRGLDRLAALGFPVLVGVSRKRMLGELLEGLPAGGSAGAEAADERPTEPKDRDLATAVVSALAARSGAWGVRVHDVPATVQALAVARAWGPDAHGDAHPGASISAATTPRQLTLGAVTSPDGIDPGIVTRTDTELGIRTGTGDRITLTGLEVFAHHGVFAYERAQGQRFLIDAELDVDLRPAAGSDELAQTVHYGELAGAIAEAVGRDPVDLIETVAERVAGVALGFPGVRSARITVHKPDAPIDATFSDVSVTVVRSPSDDPHDAQTRRTGRGQRVRGGGAG